MKCPSDGELPAERKALLAVRSPHPADLQYRNIFYSLVCRQAEQESFLLI